MTLLNYQDSLVDTLLSGDFFTAIGLADIPLTEKSSLIATMTETVCARVIKEIYESLSESDQNDLKATNPETFEPFLKSRGVDITGLMTSEALRYRMEVIMVYKTAMTPEFIDQQNSASNRALPA